MNEINISEERLKNSTLLSSPGLDIELRRIGHITFAVCDRNDGMRYAFASAELANYLGRCGTIKVTDVKLFKQTAVVGDESGDTLLLRLKLANAKIITLDNNDHIHQFEPVIARDLSSSLISPHRQWGLPPHGIAGIMLLSERLVLTIEDIADEGQHAYLIQVLWNDYQLALKVSGTSEHDRICVEGEFMTFSVKEFAHGLLIFDHA